MSHRTQDLPPLTGLPRILRDLRYVEPARQGLAVLLVLVYAWAARPLPLLAVIGLPMALAGRTPDKEWLDHVIGIVNLGNRLTHRPSELSGGQQQRVAVARALVSRPDVVFADEPTGNLDSRSGTEVLAFMRRAVDEHGQTIVMVTHDAGAAAYADRVVFLADGRIVDELTDPTAAAVFDRMKTLGD